MNEPRTRIGAYALCVASEAMLLTRLWEHDPGAGMWTLPGGGVEWGEDPADAVLRELYEETGLEGRLGEILAVSSQVMPPWGGRGELHSLQIIYRVAAEGDPRVVETDGSTVEAAWVPLPEVASVRRVKLVDVALEVMGR